MKVDLRLQENLPQVIADPVQVQQVLLNLIVNSIDAMREMTGRLRLLRISSRGCRGKVMVSVRDTGMGFVSADAITRAFEAFYTTKATGIGWPCHQSVHHHQSWWSLMGRQQHRRWRDGSLHAAHVHKSRARDRPAQGWEKSVARRRPRGNETGIDASRSRGDTLFRWQRMLRPLSRKLRTIYRT